MHVSECKTGTSTVSKTTVYVVEFGTEGNEQKQGGVGGWERSELNEVIGVEVEAAVRIMPTESSSILRVIHVFSNFIIINYRFANINQLCRYCGMFVLKLVFWLPFCTTPLFLLSPSCCITPWFRKLGPKLVFNPVLRVVLIGDFYPVFPTIGVCSPPCFVFGI